MALFPRAPHGEFNSLFRLLDDYDAHRSDRGTITSFNPRFDVREDKDAYILDGELPGVDQSDINIEFRDPHTLVVNGRIERAYQSGSPPGRRIESAEGGKGKKTADDETKFWVSERSVGEFQRSFNFPARVNQDAVKASLKHGVLNVTVPKATAPQTKKIRID
ncbi:hypothetical protein FQN57_006984 [Myotisia sp. PD_48]|nr:hypothetical protein FQN57_006984 [Myotisia sp. PD_48]